MSLLTRQEFKEQVLARSEGKCVVCGAPAVDAHHIVDRKCFDDGGYYLDNGAALCAECHLAAEDGRLTCNRLRHNAGIYTVRLPASWDPSRTYDKWGNVVPPMASLDWFWPELQRLGFADASEMLEVMAAYLEFGGLREGFLEFAPLWVRDGFDRVYNPEYGDDAECECGHPYGWHFDTCQDMKSVGCKSCGCRNFRPSRYTVSPR